MKIIKGLVGMFRAIDHWVANKSVMVKKIIMNQMVKRASMAPTFMRMKKSQMT